MNRAARVGVILPCLVPREWTEPDEEEVDREAEETAQGELLDEEADERTAMLKRSKTGPTPRPPIFHTKYGSEDQVTRKINRSFTTNEARDPVGKRIPPSERAPIHS